MISITIKIIREKYTLIVYIYKDYSLTLSTATKKVIHLNISFFNFIVIYKKCMELSQRYCTVEKPQYIYYIIYHIICILKIKIDILLVYTYYLYTGHRAYNNITAYNSIYKLSNSILYSS